MNLQVRIISYLLPLGAVELEGQRDVRGLLDLPAGHIPVLKLNRPIVDRDRDGLWLLLSAR